MNRLADKVALITGTAGGQGRAAALRFAAEGATVVGLPTSRPTRPRRRSRWFAAAGGAMTSTHPLDLADEDGRPGLGGRRGRGRHGGIDIVYNNAGRHPLRADRGHHATPTGRSRCATSSTSSSSSRRPPGHTSRLAAAAACSSSDPPPASPGRMTNHRVAHTASKGGIVAHDPAAGRRGRPAWHPGQLRQPRHDALPGDRALTCWPPTRRCATSPAPSRSAASAPPTRRSPVRPLPRLRRGVLRHRRQPRRRRRLVRRPARRLPESTPREEPPCSSTSRATTSGTWASSPRSTAAA